MASCRACAWLAAVFCGTRAKHIPWQSPHTPQLVRQLPMAQIWVQRLEQEQVSSHWGGKAAAGAARAPSRRRARIRMRACFIGSSFLKVCHH